MKALKISLIPFFLLISASVNAQSLLVTNVPYYHALPKKVDDLCNKKSNCPEMDINFIHSNKDWLTKLVNARVSQNLGVSEQIKTTVKQHVNITKTDTDYTVTKLPEPVIRSLSNFIRDAYEMMPNSGISHMLNANVTYQGHLTANNRTVEVFNVSGYQYSGGAHGLGYVDFVNIDTQLKKILTLDDIVIKGKRSVFDYLLKEQFAQWVEKEMQQPLAEYEQSWKFHVSHNFQFTPKGISVLYQSYEIAPYVSGMPEFTVSYAQLKNVIKPEYLQLGLSLR